MKHLFAILFLPILFLASCSASGTGFYENPAVFPPEGATILVASDLHYLSPAMTDYGDFFTDLIARSDGKLVHYTPEIVQAFVEEALAIHPTAIVLSGDLTLNGAPASHEGLVYLLQPLLDAKIPIHVIPGNHDVDGDAYFFDEEGAHRFDSANSMEFLEFYNHFGYQDSLSRDNHSLSYVAEINEALWMLMIDVNGYASPGIITRPTLKWVEDQLTLAQKRNITVIGVSHQNLFIHNKRFSFGYQIIGADKLIALYEKYGVILNLSGHLHLQNIEEEGSITEITTSCMAITPHQFALLKISPDLSMDYTTQPVDVSAWARRQGLTDENLLNFKEYSIHFYDKISETKYITFLADLPLDQDTKKDLMDFGVGLNRKYFTGTLCNKDAFEAGLQLWQQHAGDSRYIQYFESMLPDSGELCNRNKWTSPAR